MQLLILNPNATPRITELIAEQALQIAQADTVIHAREPSWGASSIETHIDSHVSAVAMLEFLHDAPAIDGILVSAFSDPGIDAIREVMDVPVVGIGQAGSSAAAVHGDFAILTVAQASVPLVNGMLAANELLDRCVGVYAAPVPVLAATQPDYVRGAMIDTAREIMRTSKPQSICIGGGPLGVHTQAIAETVGIPVINAVQAGVRQLQNAVERLPQGNRAPTYDLVQRKPFVGCTSTLAAIEELIWPAARQST